MEMMFLITHINIETTIATQEYFTFQSKNLCWTYFFYEKNYNLFWVTERKDSQWRGKVDCFVSRSIHILQKRKSEF